MQVTLPASARQKQHDPSGKAFAYEVAYGIDALLHGQSASECLCKPIQRVLFDGASLRIISARSQRRRQMPNGQRYHEHDSKGHQVLYVVYGK